jgi:NADH-quinone oxidoreductase subunit H
MKFGMMMLAEFIEIVVLAGVTAAVFFGGWHPVLFEETLRSWAGGNMLLWGAICGAAFLGKTMLLAWLQLVIRWTLPRFRFDQIQKLCWKMMLPFALANVFVTGALVLADPSLEWLAIVGIVELVALVALTAAASKAAAPEPDHGHGDAAHAHASGH